MTNSPNIKTVISQEPYIILNNQGEILPSINLSRPNYKLGRDGQQVDLVVPQHWTVVSRVQACFRRQGDDYYIYDGDGTKRAIFYEMGMRLISVKMPKIGSRSPIIILTNQ